MEWMLCDKDLFLNDNTLIFTKGNVYPLIKEDQTRMILKNNYGRYTYIFLGLDYSWYQYFTNIHTRPHIHKPNQNIKSYLK